MFRHRHYFIIRLFKYIVLTAIVVYVLLWLVSIPTYKQTWGLSFRPQYAESLGLDPKKVYTDILNDLKPKSIRIAAEWADIEAVRGTYDFAMLDWLVAEAKEHQTKIVLALGQKTPRWPECHNPDWVRPMSQTTRQQFIAYMRAVVTRYRDSSVIEAWQVENEPFIEFNFGQCADLHPEWVSSEVALVKALDPRHPTVITDSGELGLWTEASEAGDILGTTMYRRVALPSGRLLQYVWIPPGGYTAHAWLVGKGMKNFFVSELQAEPWYVNRNALSMPVSEQVKQFSPADLSGNISYATHVGASHVYLWGVEWWYWMKEKNGDARYWNVVKDSI